MNKTIILSQLSETIAGLTATTVADAETFVRELTALVAESLEADGRVEVPGLGTFLVSDETVVFAPDHELAEEINGPFAAFEAVELPDEEEPMPEPEPDGQQDDEEREEIAAAAEFEQAELADEPASEPVSESEPEPVKIPEYRPTSKIEQTPDDIPISEEPERRLTWLWWLAACIGCFIAGFVCGQKFVDVEPENVVEPVFEPVEVEQPAATTDKVEVAEPRPVVTDTVKSGYFLTSMARRHYGHLDFWPYIYEANAAKLDNPDRLSRGTVVIIPSADSLNLNPQNAEQLEIARKKAEAIYSRFNAK